MADRVCKSRRTDGDDDGGDDNDDDGDDNDGDNDNNNDDRNGNNDVIPKAVAVAANCLGIRITERDGTLRLRRRN